MCVWSCYAGPSGLADSDIGTPRAMRGHALIQGGVKGARDNGDSRPRNLDGAFAASRHASEDAHKDLDAGPAARPGYRTGSTNVRAGNPMTPRSRHGGKQPLTPRSSNGMLTPRSRGLESNRSVTPEKRDQYVATKGGWIQTSVTISDMNIAAWTQQKQDMFIEAVAATAQVLFLSLPASVCAAVNLFCVCVCKFTVACIRNT
jgi:hypothetical protein